MKKSTPLYKNIWKRFMICVKKYGLVKEISQIFLQLSTIKSKFNVCSFPLSPFGGRTEVRKVGRQMKNNKYYVRKISIFSILSIILSILFLGLTPSLASATTAKSVGSNYLYNFDASGTLNEAGDANTSTSPYWWLNSGGKMVVKDGRGSTVQGDLSITDPWRMLYAANNPTDTDLGAHPQNIFRLVTRSKWQNANQEAYFVIKKDNLSKSSNRNQSNGILLFNRYQDGQSLYYTGVRVDGSAIIKKKLNGTYYTMAEIKNFFPGTYNHDSNPNLLPKDKWIGLKSEVKNLANGTVNIKLFVDVGWTGKWKLAADVTDDGVKYGKAITEAGYGGIRTDFMDIQFENFKLHNL